MDDFRKLKIWKTGMDIASLCFELCNTFPRSVDLSFKSQIYRSSTSIPSNIAEGCGRSSSKSKIYFCEIALGPAFELETQVELVKRNKLSNSIELIEKLLMLLNEEGKMLNGFIKSIKTANG